MARTVRRLCPLSPVLFCLGMTIRGVACLCGEVRITVMEDSGSLKYMYSLSIFLSNFFSPFDTQFEHATREQNRDPLNRHICVNSGALRQDLGP